MTAMASSSSVTTRWSAVGTPDAAMISLAKALEPSSRDAAAAGPEAGDAGLGQRVGEAVDERRLGPDDHEVHRLVARSRDQPVEVVDAELERARIPRDAGVARRGQEVGRGRRAPQRPHDGVLAPARADDEDPHRRRPQADADTDGRTKSFVLMGDGRRPEPC